MSTGIFELGALAAAPDVADVFALVDVSDPTQAPQGSTKKITTAFLFTSPTFTGTVTAAALNLSGDFAIATTKFTVAAASGNTVVAGTLGVTGNVAVNTNKFTVTAASGNTVVAGTLGVTGVATFANTVLTGGAASTSNAGSVEAQATSIQIVGKTDSTHRAYLGHDGTNGSVGTLESFPFQIKTNNTLAVTVAVGGAVTGVSTITGTRVIGGTDIASAIAFGVFSDASTPANNSYAAANVLSQLVAKTSALSSGTQVTSEIYHKQTVANSGSVISAFSYIDAAFTSGTTTILIANVASVEATGSGGTTTTLGCYRTQALLGAGSTVTNLPLIDVRSPSGTGTVSTLVGVDVQSMTFATTTNYAIRTRINDSTFNGSGGNVGTTAQVGFLYIPTCAGPPTGVPTNAATGHIPIIYDITNNFLYVYNSGWKKSTVYA